jgi:hypothetical protein
MGLLYGAIPLIFSLGLGSKFWTLVSPYPMRVWDWKPSPPVLYYCERSVVIAFCLFVCTYQHVWHPPSKDFWIAKPLGNCHCSDFTMDKLKHNSSVFIHQSQQELVWQVLCTITAVQVSLLRGLSQSAAAPPVAAFVIHLIHCQITLISTAASLYTLNRCSWMQVSLSPLAVRSSVPARCLNHMSDSAILDSTVMLPSEEWNSFN